MFTTEEQRELFNLILDLNYDANRETNQDKKDKLEMEVTLNLMKLETLMGSDAYNTFMRRGKQMFAPKQTA
jgi:hypothetical protein